MSCLTTELLQLRVPFNEPFKHFELPLLYYGIVRGFSESTLSWGVNGTIFIKITKILKWSKIFDSMCVNKYQSGLMQNAENISAKMYRFVVTLFSPLLSRNLTYNSLNINTGVTMLKFRGLRSFVYVSG